MFLPFNYNRSQTENVRLCQQYFDLTKNIVVTNFSIERKHCSMNNSGETISEGKQRAVTLKIIVIDLSDLKKIYQ